MAEIVAEELDKEGVQVPFLEFPAQSEPASEKRKRFWKELEAAIAPAPREG